MQPRKVQPEISWGRSEGDALIRVYWWLNHYFDGESHTPRVRKVRLRKRFEPVKKSVAWVIA